MTAVVQGPEEGPPGAGVNGSCGHQKWLLASIPGRAATPGYPDLGDLVRDRRHPVGYRRDVKKG